MPSRKFVWDPAHWRFRAEETRTVADQMTHEAARTIMRRIANGYDRLASLNIWLAVALNTSDGRPLTPSGGKKTKEKADIVQLNEQHHSALVRGLICGYSSKQS